MTRPQVFLLHIALAIVLSASPASAVPVVLDFEDGPVRIFQNDGRYGPGGTLFGADDVGQQRNLAYTLRVSLEVGVAERHTLIALYAPLELTTRVSLDRDLVFNGVTFAAGETVDHRYRFNGVRVSYLFRLLETSGWRWSIGASAQIRDAAVEFTGYVDGSHAIETDIGLVGALKTKVRYRPLDALYFELDADAISSFGLFEGGGALYDVAATLGLPLSEAFEVFFRLRWVGGGADVPNQEIYNWANFGAATGGVRIDLESVARSLTR